MCQKVDVDVGFVVVDLLQRFSSANNMSSMHEYFDQFLYEDNRILVGTRSYSVCVQFLCDIDVVHTL